MVDPGSVGSLVTTGASGGAIAYLGARVILAGERLGLKLLEPYLIGRRGEAEAEALRSVADARRYERSLDQKLKADLKAIRLGTKRFDQGGNIVDVADVINPSETPLLQPASSDNKQVTALIQAAVQMQSLSRAEQLLTLREIMRLAAEAAEEMRPASNNSSDVEQAWLADWSERSSRCPDDDSMRNLWARLLVAELDDPGSQSRQTMNVLQLLGSQDAKLFQNFCQFAVNQDFIVSPQVVVDPSKNFPGFIRTFEKSALLEDGGVDIVSLLHLESIGLISGNGTMLSNSIPQTKADGVSLWLLYLAGNLLVAAINPPPDLQLPLPVIPFTKAGRDIFKLGKFKPSYDYARLLSRHMAHLLPEQVVMQDYVIGDDGLRKSIAQATLFSRGE